MLFGDLDTRCERLQVYAIAVSCGTLFDSNVAAKRSRAICRTSHDENVSAMSRLMLFPSAVKRDPAIEAWMHGRSGALGSIAREWFEVMRACGDDVRELLHDGHPTACVDEAAFCYVNVFTAHVNVGFFLGAELSDPGRLLEGTGKFMRHVKLRPECDLDAAALRTLIETAYVDMKSRLRSGEE